MLRKSVILHAVLAILLMGFLAGRAAIRPIDVQPDSYRYIEMGLNVAEHGLSIADPNQGEHWPTPAFGDGGPFIALEIGLAAAFSDDTRSALKCYLKKAGQIQGCDTSPVALKTIYTIEVAVFHFAALGIGLLLFGNPIQAWLLVAATLLFGHVGEYVTSVLTEPGYLMSSGLFLLALTYLFYHPQSRKAWCMLGLALGLTIIIKPSWLALMPLTVIGLSIAYLCRLLSLRVLISNGGVLLACAAVVFMPFIIRNGLVMDIWSLSPPSYLGQSLAHRLAYNAMSWSEWGIGWLYYLPDFGDNLSRDLFGKAAIAKLGWDPESYYVYGRDVLYYKAAEASSFNESGKWLLENYFFADLFKTTAVGLLLSWRGIFIGDLVGFVAVILMIPALITMPKLRQHAFILLALPLILIVGVNGMASVNIARYNIGLAVLYAIVIVQILSWLSIKIYNSLPSGFRTKTNVFLPK